MQVTNGIHRLTGGIANFYLIEEGSGVVLVDAGTPRDWGLFVSAMEQLGHDLTDLDAVLLTHSQADHTGFAERARSTAGSQVFIHRDDETGITTGENFKADGALGGYLFKLQMYRTMWSLGRRGAARVIPVHEVSTFEDGEVLDVPGKPRVIHAPGHTRGSCALYFESNSTLLCGDALATWNPFTGRSGPQIMPSAMNVDTDMAMRSIDALTAVPAGLVLPGHGDPWSGGVGEAVALAHAAGRS
jgi:glyoxylase-like metal-dependent hydrolase (beta-lactamase superfamily II)